MGKNETLGNRNETRGDQNETRGEQNETRGEQNERLAEQNRTLAWRKRKVDKLCNSILIGEGGEEVIIAISFVLRNKTIFNSFRASTEIT